MSEPVEPHSEPLSGTRKARSARRSRFRTQRFPASLGIACGLTLFAAAEVFAQDVEPTSQVEAGAAPEAPYAPPPPPPESTPSVEAKAAAPQEATVSEANVEPEPAPEEEASKLAPSLKIGLGVRTGLDLSVNNPSDKVQLSLHDGLANQFTARVYLSGQLTKNVGVTANFEALPFSIHVMDLILQLRLVDELQLWIGQHIPANDRTAFCGPFYHNGWNFPITVQSYPFDHDARDRGFTVWGLIAGGLIKYHLSMVDLQTGRAVENARFGGRVTLNLLDPENYYYSSGTYFGSQDTLALGAVLQYQKGVDGTPDAAGLIAGDTNGDGKLDNDFVGFSFDLLFEKNLGAAGTITLEGGYWNFESSGKEYLVNQGTSANDSSIGFSGPQPGSSYLVMLSWLTHDEVWVGKIQPNARFQFSDYTNEQKVYDVGVAYVIDGFNHRWHLNYRHVDQSANDSDSFQLGAQVQL